MCTVRILPNPFKAILLFFSWCCCCWPSFDSIWFCQAPMRMRWVSPSRFKQQKQQQKQQQQQQKQKQKKTICSHRNRVTEVMEEPKYGWMERCINWNSSYFTMVIADFIGMPHMSWVVIDLWNLSNMFIYVYLVSSLNYPYIFKNYRFLACRTGEAYGSWERLSGSNPLPIFSGIVKDASIKIVYPTVIPSSKPWLS